MSTSIQSVPYNCDTLFLQPYLQGIQNLRDAWMAQRIEDIGAAPGGAPTIREHPLSLIGRVSAVVIGILLVVPIINTLVLIILTQVDSPCLYAPLRQTDPHSLEILEPPNTATTAQEQTDQIIPEPRQAATTAQEQTDQIIPEPRQVAALARMQEIEQMGTNAIGHFELLPAFTMFPFDRILAECPSYAGELPLESCFDELIKWAEVPSNCAEQFRRFLAHFNPPATAISKLSDAHQKNITVVKTLLSKMQAYFDIRGSAPVSLNEKFNLQCQFRDALVCLSGNFQARSNFQDDSQDFPSEHFIYMIMNSLKEKMLIVVENSSTALQENLLNRLHFRAAHTICTRRAATLFGWDFEAGGSTEEEAYFVAKALSIIPSLDPFHATEEDVAAKVTAFREQEPSPFRVLLWVLTGRQPPKFYEALKQWANQHFNLRLYNTDPSLRNREMIEHIFKEDVLTTHGALFLLEAAGIIRAKDV